MRVHSGYYEEDKKHEIKRFGYIPIKYIEEESEKMNRLNYFEEVLDLPNLGIKLDLITGNGVEIAYRKKSQSKEKKILTKLKRKNSGDSNSKWNKISNAFKPKKNKFMESVRQLKLKKINETTEKGNKDHQKGSNKGNDSLPNFKFKNKKSFLIKDDFSSPYQQDFNESKTTRNTSKMYSSYINSRLNTYSSTARSKIDRNSSEKKYQNLTSRSGKPSFLNNSVSQSNLFLRTDFNRKPGSKIIERVRGYSVRSGSQTSRRNSKKEFSVGTAVKRAKMRVYGKRRKNWEKKRDRKKKPEKLADFLRYTKLDEECKNFFFLISKNNLEKKH